MRWWKSHLKVWKWYYPCRHLSLLVFLRITGCQTYGFSCLHDGRPWKVADGTQSKLLRCNSWFHGEVGTGFRWSVGVSCNMLQQSGSRLAADFNALYGMIDTYFNKLKIFSYYTRRSLLISQAKQTQGVQDWVCLSMHVFDVLVF